MKKFSLFPHSVIIHLTDASCFLYFTTPEVLQALHLSFPSAVQPSQETSHNVQVLVQRK